MTLFPEDTLAASTTITVWVGVWVVVFFNLRLGWTLSGLIVPGYLVPLLLAKPMSAGVVAVEAAITYLIVWSISEVPKLQRWCSFFGRDRFFAMVVVSVLVRCVMDGWLLPWLGEYLSETVGLDFDYSNHLHSYGLIVVSLMANYFWKPGLRRGIPPLAVSIGVTYLLVRFVLIEFTNFNLGSLQYVYEDIASSLLASPKSYIILLTTAFLASWMNLAYGWEFNGILIPALLALQWYAPLKIVASFVEAGVILLLATQLLKLPIWRGLSIQGGRKILLFFNISFAYRLLLGMAVPRFFPQVQVTDLYGFGYLLSTLLAIRAHESNTAVRLTRASLEVSLVGAVGGSLLGFLLALTPGTWFLSANQATAGMKHEIEALDTDLVETIRASKLTLYEKREPNSFTPPTPQVLSAFREGLRELQNVSDQQGIEHVKRAASWFGQANYSVNLVEDRYVLLRERTAPRGWGVYVLDLQRPDGCLIGVPAPLDEWATIEAGLTLFRHLQGGAVAIAGASRRTNTDGSADVLANSGTIYALFHRMVGRGNVLHVRGQTKTSLRSMGSRSASSATQPTSIWIKGAIPRGVNLRLLEDLIEGYDVHWRPAPLRNVLVDAMPSGSGELFLSRNDRRRLYGRLAADPNRPQTGGQLLQKEGNLDNWLLKQKATVAEAGTDLYVPADVNEMLYLDEEVLGPVLRIARRVPDKGHLSSADLEELNAAASAAAVLGYQLTLFHDLGSDSDVLGLSEAPDSRNRRYWGTHVFRLGLIHPHVVQVPRPLYETNTWEYGVSLMQRMQASALSLAGAHPYANLGGHADVVRLANKVNMFQLVHQVLLRETGDRPMLVVQVRAIKAPVKADVVVATDDGTTHRGELSFLKAQCVDKISHPGADVTFVDGGKETAGYEFGANLQAMSLQLFAEKEMVTLWLSPSLRTAYRQQTSQRLQDAQFETLEITTIHGNLHEFLTTPGPGVQAPTLPEDMVDAIQTYLNNRDIVALQFVRDHPAGAALIRFVDGSSQRAFLIISAKEAPHQLPHVVSLADLMAGQQRVFSLPRIDRRGIQDFIDSRATWLELVRRP